MEIQKADKVKTCLKTVLRQTYYSDSQAKSNFSLMTFCKLSNDICFPFISKILFTTVKTCKYDMTDCHEN